MWLLGRTSYEVTDTCKGLSSNYKVAYIAPFPKIVAGFDEDLDPRQPRDLQRPDSYTDKVGILKLKQC